MNDRKAADALLATLWVFRDLIAREAGDYAGLKTAVKEAVDATAIAEMSGIAAGHLPKVKEKVQRVDDVWFSCRYDLTDPLIPYALHAIMVALDAFEATVEARATA